MAILFIYVSFPYKINLYLPIYLNVSSSFSSKYFSYQPTLVASNAYKNPPRTSL